MRGRSAAVGFDAWAGAADDLRRRCGLARRAAARMRGRGLSAAWGGWADAAYTARRTLRTLSWAARWCDARVTLGAFRRLRAAALRCGSADPPGDLSGDRLSQVTAP
jgi:hypothetical protein